MKKIILFLALAAISFTGKAQCTTTWPYLYPEFQEGKVTLNDGKVKSEKINIHLLKDEIHFIDQKNIVRLLSPVKFIKVEISGTTFVQTGKGLLKVIAQKDGIYIGAKYLADLSVLNETGGAYGTSSVTSSTTKVSGIATNAVNTSIMELRQHFKEGSPLTLSTTYYIVSGGKATEADKKEIMESLPAEKQATFKSFLKGNKINWKDTSSLEKVLEFMAKN